MKSVGERGYGRDEREREEREMIEEGGVDWREDMEETREKREMIEEGGVEWREDMEETRERGRG